MAFNTKLNLSCTKFTQVSGSTLNLSGCTNIYGCVDVFGKHTIKSGATLSILPNHGAGKILVSDANGFATWQVNTSTVALTGATNGLTKIGQNIVLGGELTGISTNVVFSGKSFNAYSNNVGLFLSDISGSCSSILCGSGATLSLNGCASMSSKYSDSLTMCPTRTVFCSGTGGGIKYNADYSGTYTVRSLTDVGYVSGLTSTLDSRIDTIEAIYVTGATNGLTKSGAHDVKLGGMLTGNTQICLDGNILDINNGVLIGLQLNSATCTANLSASGSTISLGGTITTWSSRYNDCIRMGADGMFVNNVTTCEGLKYCADYSPYFTNRSLVDKDYVDNQVLTGTSCTAILCADNGLTKLFQSVRLGGTLDNNTTIDSTNKQFSIMGTGTTLSLYDNDNLVLLHGSGATVLLVDGKVHVYSKFCDRLSMCSGSTTFCSATGGGIKYDNNYHASFTCRSLVDKEYVDNMVFTGTSANGVTGATNLGVGNGTIFTNVTANKINLKTLSGGTNVTLTCNANYIGINVPTFSNLAWTGTTANGVGTYVSATKICSQPNMTFDGTQLRVTGNICATTCVRSALVSGTTVCGGVVLGATYVCSPLITGSTKICSPIVIGTTCVSTPRVLASISVCSPLITGSTKICSPIVAATSCVTSPIVFGTTCVCSPKICTTAQLVSTQATGTSPFSIASTTLNANLNADLLDGIHGSGFTLTTTFNTFTGTTLPAGYYNKTQINSYTGKTQAIFTDIHDPSGFINNCNIVVTYSSVNRTITLSATTGNVEYYFDGVKYSLGTCYTSSAHTNNTTMWFLYSTDGTNIAWSNTVWSYTALMIAARPANTTIGLREIHGIMPHDAHLEFHQTIGTYRESGFGFTNGTYAVQPVSPTDADNRPGFEAGVVKDEDISTTLSAWLENSYTRLYFTSASTYNFETAQPNIFRTGTTYPLYNPYNGTGFTEVEMTGGTFANWYVVRIPVTADAGSQLYRAVILQPQFQHGTLEDAQSENPQSLFLGGLINLFAEFVLVERITLRTDSGYTSTGKVRIEALTVLTGSRFNQTNTTIGVATVTAGNVSVAPTAPFTSTNLQDLADEYAAAFAVRGKYCQFTISGNSSATGFTVTHNMCNQFVMTQIVQASSPYATVYTDVLRPNISCVCVTFDTAPPSGTNYKVLITG